MVFSLLLSGKIAVRDHIFILIFRSLIYLEFLSRYISGCYLEIYSNATC
jgi:hypothetical protein